MNVENMENLNARGILWEDEEVLALIHIWGDSRIQQDLDGCSRKRPIFERIAKQLKEQGFVRSFAQVREKIKQLKQRYKKIKDSNNRSGNKRRTCPFYKELDDILGDRPITNPPKLLDSMEAEEEHCLEEIERNFSTEEKEESLEDEATEESSILDEATEESLVSEESNLITSPMDPGSSTTPKENFNEGKEKSRRKPKDKVSNNFGKSKKRTRRETFLSEICSMLSEQQKISDERFFAQEEERRVKEVEEEKKRRKEEQDHEVYMMHFIGNMFMQAAASLSQYSQVNAQATPNHYPFHATRPQQQIDTDREDEALYENLF